MTTGARAARGSRLRHNATRDEAAAPIPAPPYQSSTLPANNSIPASGLSVRKWLNTSGQSYRALGKEAVAAMSDEALRLALARDGKLVKRPVLVDGGRVVVGFREEAYVAHYGAK